MLFCVKTSLFNIPSAKMKYMKVVNKKNYLRVMKICSRKGVVGVMYFHFMSIDAIYSQG